MSACVHVCVTDGALNVKPWGAAGGFWAGGRGLTVVWAGGGERWLRRRLRRRLRANSMNPQSPRENVGSGTTKTH